MLMSLARFTNILNPFFSSPLRVRLACSRFSVRDVKVEEGKSLLKLFSILHVSSSAASLQLVVDNDDWKFKLLPTTLTIHK